MATTLKCEFCNNTHRYDGHEIKNIGTIWQPILKIDCKSCGKPNIHEEEKLSFLDNATYIKNNDISDIYDISFITIDEKYGIQKAVNSKILEFWIQQYFFENYKKLGFSKIKGAFNIGPDFKGIPKGKKRFIDIEIERDCKTYITHKHHKSKRFENVKVLIVLNPEEPTEKIKKYLPEEIIYIDIKDFAKWWAPQEKKKADIEKLNNLVNILAGEFHKKFMEICDFKEKDMAICPKCDYCPYFLEEAINEASALFWNMAIKFLIQYKYLIGSENFKISSIKNEEMDSFFNNYF